ncbi:MAG TPA: hypothetical protein VEZ72_01835, partial [Paenibacillus sp.]|nr:hypothetical protein [Paenibacillus sp.]
QPRRPYLRQAIGGFAADDNFVLYYGLETYNGVDLMRLVRWDYRNGKDPENLGIVSPEGKQSQYICEMLFDDEGILHLVDVCGEYSPYVLAVDLRGLEPPGPDAEPAAIRPLQESDMHMNADRSYFMHIEADSMRVTPLHRSVGLGRANLVHLSKGEDRVCGIAGNDHPIFVSIDDKDGAVWTKAYPALGAPLGAVALPDRRIAVTTSCGHAAIFRSDGALDRMHPLPFPLRPGKPLAVVGGALILRDALTGELHLMSIGSGKIEPLEGIRLPQADAAIIPLSPQEFLYSGESNVLTSYRIDAGTTALWPIEAPYVKGRQFRAYLTGGLALEDGRVFAGTSDGMAFSIGADRARAKRYGRLFSTGCLRDFVAADERSVFAVYGGMKDAGRVVRLSDEDGLIDLGRPRVIKDNVQLVDSESEWASIHHISKIAFAGGALFVASAEALGGVIRYEWPERPKGAASG